MFRESWSNLDSRRSCTESKLYLQTHTAMLKRKVSDRNMDCILDLSCERREKRHQASKYANKHLFPPVENRPRSLWRGSRKGLAIWRDRIAFGTFRREDSMSTNSSFACLDIAAEVLIAKIKYLLGIFIPNVLNEWHCIRGWLEEKNNWPEEKHP